MYLVDDVGLYLIEGIVSRGCEVVFSRGQGVHLVEGI